MTKKILKSAINEAMERGNQKHKLIQSMAHVERLDIVAENIINGMFKFPDYHQDREGILRGADLHTIMDALFEIKDRERGQSCKGDRNWMIFLMRAQYRLPYTVIASTYEIATSRARDLTYKELAALVNVLRSDN